MRFRRKHREVPGLNTTSTADISFMLLVFFLVTSSMDTDHGLARKMAPIDEHKQEQQDVNRSNVLQISNRRPRHTLMRRQDGITR